MMGPVRRIFSFSCDRLIIVELFSDGARPPSNISSTFLPSCFSASAADRAGFMPLLLALVPIRVPPQRSVSLSVKLWSGIRKPINRGFPPRKFGAVSSRFNITVMGPGQNVSTILSAILGKYASLCASFKLDTRTGSASVYFRSFTLNIFFTAFLLKGLQPRP